MRSIELFRFALFNLFKQKHVNSDMHVLQYCQTTHVQKTAKEIIGNWENVNDLFIFKMQPRF